MTYCQKICLKTQTPGSSYEGISFIHLYTHLIAKALRQINLNNMSSVYPNSVYG